MKRRILLVGCALAALFFVLGISVAAAANKTAGKTKTIVLKCHVNLATVPPAGSAAVDQPPAQGTSYGQVHCPSIGTGVESASFKVPDSGDTVGNYWQYFGTGAIHGKFDITPEEGSGSISATNFESESWTGTVTVIGGTGVYKGAAGKTGTLKCRSNDTVHLTCVESMKLSSL